jgi:hypothetical protein
VKTLAILALLICQVADAQTNFFPVLVCSNTTYTNATIEAVTPATVTVWWSGGGERISITNLPAALQKLYNYNPVEAKKYLTQQAAKKAKIQQQANENQEALAKARSYVGEAQTIRVLGMVNDMSCQIEVKGQLAEAFIPNLPYDVVAFLHELDQTRANAANLRAKAKQARYDANQAKAIADAMLVDNVYYESQNARANLMSNDARALEDNATEAESALRSLQTKTKGRTTIIARVTGKKGADGSREWRFEKMAMPESTER